MICLAAASTDIETKQQTTESDNVSSRDLQSFEIRFTSDSIPFESDTLIRKFRTAPATFAVVP